MSHGSALCGQQFPSSKQPPPAPCLPFQQANIQLPLLSFVCSTMSHGPCCAGWCLEEKGEGRTWAGMWNLPLLQLLLPGLTSPAFLPCPLASSFIHRSSSLSLPSWRRRWRKEDLEERQDWDRTTSPCMSFYSLLLS